MVICDVEFDTKYDPVIQNLSQEPSMSSKYDCVLDALLIILGSWKWATTQYWHILVIPYVKFDTKYEQILQNSSQKLLMSSMYDCVHDELLFTLGS